MKNRKPILIILLLAMSISTLVASPVSIRSVDFIKILALGACIGALIMQLFKSKN